MQTNHSWDGATRGLHWGLALLITFQLFGGLLVSAPNTLVYFYIHEFVGLFAAVVVLFTWLWGYANDDMPLLFPWGGEGRAEVMKEVKELLKGKLPKVGRRRGLSSFVHGLGLLAVTGMSATGVLIFFVIPGGHGASASSTHYGAFTELAVMHRSLANLVWAYWFGHVGFAVLHQLKGNNVFAAIFGSGVK